MRSETTRRLTFPRGAWAGGLLAVALVVGGCGGGSSKSDSTSQPATTGANAAPTTTASKGPVKVSITDFKFAPKSVTVAVGAKVTWTNEDSAPHTATASDQNSFDTGTLKQGQSKTLALTKAGTYSYVCEFHPFMTAKVVVR